MDIKSDLLGGYGMVSDQQHNHLLSPFFLTSEAEGDDATITQLMAPQFSLRNWLYSASE